MNMIRLSTFLFFTLLVSVACSDSGLSEAPKPSPVPPKGIRVYEIGSAPDFSLQDLDGETHKLSDKQGRWVFLHFWASWCGPCRREMPEIQQLITHFSDDELAIVMVNTAEDEDAVFSFLAEIGIEAHSLLDADGQVTEVWKPRGLPTSFLIDPDGEVRFQAIGGRAWSNPAYIGFLKQLIAQPSKE